MAGAFGPGNRPQGGGPQSIKYKIEVDTGQASKAVDDLTQRTQRLADTTAKASQGAARGMVVGGVGPVQGTNYLPGGGATSGASTPAGAFDNIAKLATAAGTALGVIGLADAIGKLAVHTGTARQKISELGGALPVIGHIIAGISEAALSINDTIMSTNRLASHNPEVRMIALQSHTNAVLYGANVDRARQFGSIDQAAADRATDITTRGQYGTALSDRNMYGGFLNDPSIAGTPAERYARMRESSRDASIRAERDATTARLTAASGRNRLDSAEAQSRLRFGGPGSLMGDMSLPELRDRVSQEFVGAQGNPWEERGFRRSAARLGQEVGNASADLKNYEVAIADARERSLSVAQRDYDLAKTKTNELRTQVDILRDQEEEARGASRQFGMMAPDQRYQILSDLKTAKAAGFENLTPEQKARLAGSPATSDYATQEAEKLGEKDPVLKQIRALTGQKDVATIAAERVKLEAEIRVKVEFDEQKMIQAIDKAMGEFDARVKDLIVKQVQVEQSRAMLNTIAGATASR